MERLYQETPQQLCTRAYSSELLAKKLSARPPDYSARRYRASRPALLAARWQSPPLLAFGSRLRSRTHMACNTARRR